MDAAPPTSQAKDTVGSDVLPVHCASLFAEILWVPCGLVFLAGLACPR